MLPGAGVIYQDHESHGGPTENIEGIEALVQCGSFVRMNVGRISDVRGRIYDVGCRICDVGWRIYDAGCRICDIGFVIWVRAPEHRGWGQPDLVGFLRLIRFMYALSMEYRGSILPCTQVN